MSWLVKILASRAGGWIAGGLAFAVLAGFGVAYFSGRADGRALEAAANIAAVQDERDRVEAANAESLALANERVIALTIERDMLAATVADMREEAANDPQAERPAFSRDAVIRLNRIR